MAMLNKPLECSLPGSFGFVLSGGRAEDPEKSAQFQMATQRKSGNIVGRPRPRRLRRLDLSRISQAYERSILCNNCANYLSSKSCLAPCCMSGSRALPLQFGRAKLTLQSTVGSAPGIASTGFGLLWAARRAHMQIDV